MPREPVDPLRRRPAARRVARVSGLVDSARGRSRVGIRRFVAEILRDTTFGIEAERELRFTCHDVARRAAGGRGSSSPLGPAPVRFDWMYIRS